MKRKFATTIQWIKERRVNHPNSFTEFGIYTSLYHDKPSDAVEEAMEVFSRISPKTRLISLKVYARPKLGVFRREKE